jgi:hypothetical protein
MSLRVRAVCVFLLIASFTAAPHRVAAHPGDADPVRAWNELALTTVRTLRLTDAQAARLYAMVNVAMYDAVNGILTRRGKPESRYQAMVPDDTAPPLGNPAVAAAAAAHAVLTGELAGTNPSLAATYDEQLQRDLMSGYGVTAGREWGAWVGAQVRLLRTGDGSTPNESQPGNPAPGQFRASWSGVQFRNLRPFAIASAAPYVGSGPPALDSLVYATAFAEVKVQGNAAIADASAMANYNFWSLGAGTTQPPGAWIQVALSVTAQSPLPLPEMTRLFALLSMALSDTVAPTVMTKYVYHSWRPTTAITEAHTDGNANTDPDTSWSARAGTVGGSPEYWSGHSTFSGAGAAALAAFYCADNVPFALTTDSAAPGEVRHYTSFSQAAAEAGQSRIDGGLHFRFSDLDARVAGQAIVAEIAATSLLRRHGPTHFGQCPR